MSMAHNMNAILIHMHSHMSVCVNKTSHTLVSILSTGASLTGLALTSLYATCCFSLRVSSFHTCCQVGT